MSLSAAFRTLLLAVLLAGVSPLVDAAGQTWIQIDKTARTLTLFEGDVPLLEFLNGVALDALVVNGEHRFERRIAPPETRLPLLAD